MPGLEYRPGRNSSKGRRKAVSIVADGKQKKERQSSLSVRQKAVLQMLAQTAPRPVTLAAISEKLGVSSRTVLREMPAVEKWLTDNDFRFSRKPGIGMAIEEQDENLGLIRELLEMENIIPMYNRQERRRHILGELFFAAEPVKAYAFTSVYHISEGTLYDDLDVLAGWLKEYRVEIVRRPGTGIFLKGTETALRQAISGAVFEFIDVDKILELLSKNAQKKKKREILTQNPLLGFWDFDIVQAVTRLLADSGKRLGVKYTDHGYIGLVVRISLAVGRMRDGKYNERPAQDLKRFRATPEMAAAEYMAGELGREFSLSFPAEETGYFALYLSSARIWSSAAELKDPLQNMNTRQIVMSMAAIAEQLTKLPFRSCTRMADDLVEHINAFISRASVNLRMENPQPDLVQQSYPEIYEAVKTSCEVLREFIAPREIPESEIGYIAMHFAAAAEQLQENERKIRAVVVCPAGIGTSKVLSVNLMRLFGNLEVQRIISAFDIDEEQLRREGIDLIISTTEIQTDFPHLRVGMILQTQDKLMIRNAIEEINRRRIHQKTRSAAAPFCGDGTLTLDFIRHASLIGSEIVEILEHFRIRDAEQAESFDRLVSLAAAMFTGKEDEQERIAAGIRKREEIGDTFFPDMHIYLFHCITDVTKHSRFGFLRLVRPLAGEKGEVRGAVVMLAPDEGQTRECYETISALSALLVDDSRFLQALQEGDAAAGAALAEQALVKYYKNETMKRIGVN